MLKNRGHIESDARLLDALKLMFSKKLVVLPVYEKERLVGVVRDADLFLAVADMILS
jgi:CBS domain-containing protein